MSRPRVLLMRMGQRKEPDEACLECNARINQVLQRRCDAVCVQIEMCCGGKRNGSRCESL